MKMIIYYVTTSIVCYLIITISIYYLSEGWMFPIPSASYKNLPNTFSLIAQDGKKITAIYLKNVQADYTILYSHGNGEDLGDIIPILKGFQKNGFSILAYDYHGYGTSAGAPTEKNVYYDINAAYHYLTDALKIPSEKIILYGRSIGSGPTIDLAVREPIAGVILENPLISIFRVVTGIPLFPVDRFRNNLKIDQIKVPIFILHARNDQVVPIWQGRALYQLAKSPKKIWEIEGAGHNDILLNAGEVYWQNIQSFSKSLK